MTQIPKENYEFLESKLRKEGFRNFQIALEIAKLFKKYKNPNYLVLDFRDKYHLVVWSKDEEEKKIWKATYPSLGVTILLESLRIAASKGYLREAVDIDTFKEEVSNSHPSIYRGAVRDLLLRPRSWANNIYKINERENTIQLLLPVKEVLY